MRSDSQAGVHLIREWWTQPFDFEMMVHQIREHGFQRVLRAIMLAAAATYFLVAVTCTIWLVNDDLGRPFGVYVTAICTVGSLVTAVMLFRYGRLVSERASLVAVAIADVSIVAFALSFTELYSALPGLSLLACLGIYLVAFHRPRTVLIHLCYSAAALFGCGAVCLVTGVPWTDVVSRVGILVLIILVTPMLLLPLVLVLRSHSQDSRRDPLTGLANRRALAAHALVSKKAATHTVLMIDVDDFKSINDEHGHGVGDDVLVAIADELDELAPAGAAIAARIGGEEFALFTTCPTLDTTPLAENILRRVRSISVAGVDDVTVSVGVAVGRADGDFHQLLRRADELMYRAKRSGGDRAVIDATIVEATVPGPHQPRARTPDAGSKP